MTTEIRRLAIVNRGEPAIRALAAVAGAQPDRTSAPADHHRGALHRPGRGGLVRARGRRGGLARPGHVRRPGRRQPPVAVPGRARRCSTRCARAARRRRLGRLGLPGRARVVRAALRGGRHRVRRPGQRDDPAARRQGGRQADRRSRPACRSCRGAAGRSTTSPTRPARPRGLGYSLVLKAAMGGGGRGIRVVHAEAELAIALRLRPRAGGTVRLRRSDLLPGAPGPRRPARRGPDHRRRVRHGLGRRRPRLHAAAPPPEGDRGVGVDRARRRPPSRRSWTAAVTGGRRRRIPQRRHGRVPRRPGHRPVLLPGGQHPAAGRAPGDRDDHRAGPGQAAAARRRRRPADRPARHAARARRRGAAVRRGPGERASPRHPAGSRGSSCRPARASGSTPGSARATDPTRLRLDDREDHRLGPGPDAALARLRRALGQTIVVVAGRHHEPVVPAEPARPAGGARRPLRQPLAGPAHRRGRARAGRRIRWPCWSPRSSRTTSSRPPRGPPSTPRRPGAAPIRREVGHRCRLRYRGQRYDLRVYRTGAAHLPGRRRRRHRRRRRRAARRVRAAGASPAAGRTGW